MPYAKPPIECTLPALFRAMVSSSYNAVLGKPTCLSPIIRKSRELWGFRGYVTSDSDSVHDAYNPAPPHGNGHAYPQPHPTPEKATALAMIDGMCDIDSGDTYNNYLLPAVSSKTEGLNMSHVDRALYNSFKQRFDLGLFDPQEAYAWPGKMKTAEIEQLPERYRNNLRYHKLEPKT